MNSVFRKAGKHVAQRAVAKQSRPGGLLDFRFGFRLLRDPRVPLTPKVVAFALGVALTAMLLAFEIPLEALVGMFLPVLGVGLDLLVDGVEFLVMPALLASLLIPHFMPPRQEA